MGGSPRCGGISNRFPRDVPIRARAGRERGSDARAATERLAGGEDPRHDTFHVRGHGLRDGLRQDHGDGPLRAGAHQQEDVLPLLRDARRPAGRVPGGLCERVRRAHQGPRHGARPGKARACPLRVLRRAGRCLRAHHLRRGRLRLHPPADDRAGGGAGGREGRAARRPGRAALGRPAPLPGRDAAHGLSPVGGGRQANPPHRGRRSGSGADVQGTAISTRRERSITPTGETPHACAATPSARDGG